MPTTGTNKPHGLSPDSPLNGNWNAWADIVIKTWRQKQIILKVGAYRQKRQVKHEPLYLSFQRHVTGMASGQNKTIEFLFNSYGIFVDMGVGKETSIGNSGDLADYATETTANGKKRLKRKAKPWFNKVWFSEVMKLREHMAARMGKAAANEIMFGLQTNISASMAESQFKERNIINRSLMKPN
jgi:hypothetical protein